MKIHKTMCLGIAATAHFFGFIVKTKEHLRRDFHVLDKRIEMSSLINFCVGFNALHGRLHRCNHLELNFEKIQKCTFVRHVRCSTISDGIFCFSRDVLIAVLTVRACLAFVGNQLATTGTRRAKPSPGFGDFFFFFPEAEVCFVLAIVDVTKIRWNRSNGLLEIAC